MADIGVIRDMARIERPRERLGALGVEALKEEELLALVLRTGVRGQDALAVARLALEQHSLQELARLPMPALRRLRGFGAAKAASWTAALELARRAQAGGAEDARPRIQTIQDLLPLLLDIRSKKKEHLVAFFLNARHQLLTMETVSIGTLTASLAHPREIFAPAIGQAAAGVILAHNHPSGDPSPSEEDIRLTRRIQQAGQILGIELLDHLIVAERGRYSFKTSGGIL